MASSVPVRILITGMPGVGKTTLIRKICEALKSKSVSLSGFYTEEVRGPSGYRQGFDVVTLDGNRGSLARTSAGGSERLSGPRVGKYAVLLDQFEAMALPCLEDATADVMVIDEIGKMETFSKRFVSMMERVFSGSSSVILATVPYKRIAPFEFFDKIRSAPGTTLFVVTVQNRDSLAEQVLKLILEAVGTK